MTEPKRPRGRPKRFTGKKDKATFSAAVMKTLPAVVAFIEEWQLLLEISERQRGVNRREQALEFTAKKFHLSRRTLERRYRELRFIAEPIACLRISSANPPEIAIHFDDPSKS